MGEFANEFQRLSTFVLEISQRRLFVETLRDSICSMVSASGPITLEDAIFKAKKFDHPSTKDQFKKNSYNKMGKPYYFSKSPWEKGHKCK